MAKSFPSSTGGGNDTYVYETCKDLLGGSPAFSTSGKKAYSRSDSGSYNAIALNAKEAFPELCQLLDPTISITSKTTTELLSNTSELALLFNTNLVNDLEYFQDISDAIFWSGNDETTRDLIRNGRGYRETELAQYDWVPNLGGSSSDIVTSVTWKPDGTKFYLWEYTPEYITEYDCSTPWDVTTASPSGAAVVINSTTNARGMIISGDGQFIIVTDDTSNTLDYWTMSTPWDLSTATNTSTLSSFDGQPLSLYMSPDGNNLYYSGGNKQIRRYPLSTPFDPSSAGAQTNFDTSVDFNFDVYSISFNSTGTKMFLMGSSSNVSSWTLSTPWDVTTLTYDGDSSIVSFYSEIGFCYAFVFSADGTKAYFASDTTLSLNEFSLSTPWDLSTADTSDIFTITTPLGNLSNCWDGTNVSTIRSARFSRNGRVVYGYSSNGDYCSRVLSTPYDIDSYVGTVSKDVASNWGNAVGQYSIQIPDRGSDGDPIYMYSLSNANLYRHELVAGGEQFKITDYNTSPIQTNPTNLGSNAANRMHVCDNGERMLCWDGTGSKTLRYYTMTTKWSPSAMTYNGTVDAATLGLTTSDQVYDIQVTNTGTKMWMMIYDQSSDRTKLYVWDLSTPYDPSTATISKEYKSHIFTGFSGSFNFSVDGAKMYFIADGNTGNWSRDFS